MTTPNFTPSPRLQALAIEAAIITTNPQAVENIRTAVMNAVDEAIQSGATKKDNVLMIGYSAGANVLWDRGHSPKEAGITSYPLHLAREYTSFVMNNQKTAVQEK
ncbi:MAG: hypothetical protein NTX63_05625 [Candidatus Peregrinibacteria bacterium]|nr:hypothetical protein [Candidatus Peregrinibacteria bacterium]